MKIESEQVTEEEKSVRKVKIKFQDLEIKDQPREEKDKGKR